MASFTDITNSSCTITDYSNGNALFWCSPAFWCGSQTWCGGGYGSEWTDTNNTSSNFVDY